MIKADNRSILIPTDDIIVTELNIRTIYDEDRLDELSSSQAEVGTLMPLLVRPHLTLAGKYELLLGSRRYYGAQRAMLPMLPCRIVEHVIKTDDVLILMLTENLQRQDLTPFEEASAILKLINDHKWSITQVAQKLGKHETFVRRRIQLLSVPTELQALVSTRKLGLGHIEALSQLGSADEQIAFAERVVEKSLDAETLVHLLTEQGKRKTNPTNKSTVPVSAERVTAKTRALDRYLQSTVPAIQEMYGTDQTNIAVALGDLEKTIHQILTTIKGEEPERKSE